MKKLVVIALVLFASCSKKDDSAAKTDPAPPGAAVAPKPTTAPPMPAPAAGTARPASVSDADVALADSLVATMKDFGDALDKAGTDCKAATAVAKEYAAKFKPIAEQAEKIKERTKSDPAVGQWFQSNYLPKMMALGQPMMKSAAACASDKDFQEAFKSVEMPGRKVKAAAP